MSDLPQSVQINEEGPREGFQFERGPIATARKVELIDALSVNEKGLERAIACGRLDLSGSISLTASEPFLERNQNRSLADNIAMQHNMIRLYQRHGIPVERGSIMAAFGCNFAGDTAIETVVDMVEQIVDIAEEHDIVLEVISLADTMAWATPLSIKQVVGAVRERFPLLDIALHLHDTRGMGIANAYAGLEMGVGIFDSAVAGLGGCPFAAHRGAAGNVCTEDLVFMCEEMGIATGGDLERLIEAARLAEDIVGHPLPGSVKLGGSLAALHR